MAHRTVELELEIGGHKSGTLHNKFRNEVSLVLGPISMSINCVMQFNYHVVKEIDNIVFSLKWP